MTEPADPKAPPEAPPPPPSRSQLEEGARVRAQKAKERARKRKSSRREKQKAEEAADKQRAAEGDAEWFQLPSQQELQSWIRSGIEAARLHVVRPLEEGCNKSDPVELDELKEFKALAVVGDIEVFCLSTGLAGLAHKYKLWIARFAPELLTGAGVLFFAAKQLKLRRESAALAQRWSKRRSSSPSVPAAPEKAPS